jgi:hypothetical protein
MDVRHYRSRCGWAGRSAVTDLEGADEVQPELSGTVTLRLWGDDLIELSGVDRRAIWYGEPVGEAIVERLVARL